MYFFLGLLEALLQQSEDINPKEEIDPGSRQEGTGSTNTPSLSYLDAPPPPCPPSFQLS